MPILSGRGASIGLAANSNQRVISSLRAASTGRRPLGPRLRLQETRSPLAETGEAAHSSGLQHQLAVSASIRELTGADAPNKHQGRLAGPAEHHSALHCALSGGKAARALLQGAIIDSPLDSGSTEMTLSVLLKSVTCQRLWTKNLSAFSNVYVM